MIRKYLTGMSPIMPTVTAIEPESFETVGSFLNHMGIISHPDASIYVCNREQCNRSNFIQVEADDEISSDECWIIYETHSECAEDDITVEFIFPINVSV